MDVVSILADKIRERQRRTARPYGLLLSEEIANEGLRHKVASALGKRGASKKKRLARENTVAETRTQIQLELFTESQKQGRRRATPTGAHKGR